MATNPVPISELDLIVDRAPYEIIIHCTGRITSDTGQLLKTTFKPVSYETIVHCTGRITSDTGQLLKTTVKPLFSASNIVVLDLTNVSYMDSSGLGAIVGLCVSAKAAHSRLKLVNMNQRLKELFSITRLGQVLG
jgi:anti-sigma B factor antagonist